MFNVVGESYVLAILDQNEGEHHWEKRRGVARMQWSLRK